MLRIQIDPPPPLEDHRLEFTVAMIGIIKVMIARLLTALQRTRESTNPTPYM